MIQRSRSLLLVGCFLGATSVMAQSQGEILFTQTCVACHTIGGGRLVGPDLANVHFRRDEAWLIRFIQSPQSLVAEGDTVAVALVDDYNGLIMPDQALSENRVRSILEYIAIQSPPGNEPVSDEPVALVETTQSDIALGQDLFVGRVRFANGGAACSSCHNVRTDDVMTGGSLAKDLSTSVERLSRSGVDAMMRNPPFPAMQSAFAEKSLTPEEISAIGAFLQSVGEVHLSQTNRDYGDVLTRWGLAGMLVLLGLFSLLGIRATKRTVNHHIYDRQTRTRQEPTIR